MTAFQWWQQRQSLSVSISPSLSLISNMQLAQHVQVIFQEEPIHQPRISLSALRNSLETVSKKTNNHTTKAKKIMKKSGTTIPEELRLKKKKNNDWIHSNPKINLNYKGVAVSLLWLRYQTKTLNPLVKQVVLRSIKTAVQLRTGYDFCCDTLALFGCC